MERITINVSNEKNRGRQVKLDHKDLLDMSPRDVATSLAIIGQEQQQLRADSDLLFTLKCNIDTLRANQAKGQMSDADFRSFVATLFTDYVA
jgi:hypothetical protein